MEVPQKIKIELPYDSAIPFLSIHPKELRTEFRRDTGTSIFIATSFTIAKTQKQPKCPQTNKRISKRWYVHTMDVSLKKEANSAMLQHR